MNSIHPTKVFCVGVGWEGYRGCRRASTIGPSAGLGKVLMEIMGDVLGEVMSPLTVRFNRLGNPRCQSNMG